MKYCLPFLLVIFVSFIAGNVAAKENRELLTANFYYNHGDFHEAIPYYEKIADEVKDPAVYAQLADCYRLTGIPATAAIWYDKAVKLRGCGAIVMLRYGQVLMQLAQYANAEKWLKQYQKNSKGDRRAANLVAGCAYAQKIAKEIPSGTTSATVFNTDGSEFAPTMWNGKLVFAADTVIGVKKKTDKGTGNAFYNIYSVSCDNKGTCDTGITVVAGPKRLSIKYHTGPCTFSADGKQMYYTRTRFNDNFLSKRSVSNKDTVVVQEIMIASGYDSAKKEFTDISSFQYNDGNYSVAYPSVSPNGKTLVFTSNMPKGAGGCDLYVCRKTAAGDWSKPVSAGNTINTEGEEVFPYWADDNTLYFSSDGHVGLGGLDIYRSHWNEKNGTFSKPENMDMPINSSYDDISLAMFADGRSTYLSSNRPAAKKSDNIYFYQREEVLLLATITDSITGKPLPGAKVSLSTTKDNREIAADNSGKVLTRLYPKAQYNVTASKDDYESKQLVVTATSVSGNETDTIRQDIKLRTLQVVVRDTVTPAKVDKELELGHFYYAYDKYQLTAEHQRVLDTMIALLNSHPSMRIEILSHTDCRGSKAYNSRLSNKRALSVVNYFIKHSVARNRLEYVSLGFSSPAFPCPDCKSCTEEQHRLNRVLDFRILHP